MHIRTSSRISDISVPAILWIVAVAGLSATVSAADDSAPVGQFRAACVKVDITPDTPQWLHGYGPRQSEGVHDHIYHRIVAMDDGAKTFFLVSTDICTISMSHYQAFCKKLERETQGNYFKLRTTLREKRAIIEKLQERRKR